MIYAGIGARATPDTILNHMITVGAYMASCGHTLRSGGAPKADTAFEEGCDKKDGSKEIYLPYKFFNKNKSSLFGTTKEARLHAKNFHPNWNNVSCKGRDFLARNSYQMLGLDLKTPTDLVICFTKNGKIEGGTGQALRIADHYQIPILNFGSQTLDEISEYLKKL